MAVGLCAAYSLSFATVEVGVDAWLRVVFLSAFPSGMILRHWSAFVISSCTVWAVIVALNAYDSGEWRGLLPRHWLESLGEPSFYLLSTIALSSTLGLVFGLGLSWAWSRLAGLLGER